MRVVFMGSPAAAVPPLRALAEHGHDVALVVTNPPRRRGRREEPSPTPVQAEAERLGLEVGHDLDRVTAVGAELGVVVAFGRLVPAGILERLRMVNLHFSLLPRWRGAAPVQRAILAGDERTGVCLMELEEGLDTGGLFGCSEIELTPSSTAAGVTEVLSGLGAQLLVEKLAEPLGTPVPQPAEGVTYASKITVEELRLDWSRPAEELSRSVRVGEPGRPSATAA
ncbi:MAG: methionyl-tRNA formyltransferase [Microthrixaceae bacterium]